MAKAVFLDRDGTINVDYGYVFRREDFRFTDGVFEFCRQACEHGYILIVITNQSGIARGYYTEEDYRNLTTWMVGEFEREGVKIADVLHCPSLNGPDRKPAPGLFLRAAEKHGLDLAQSISIGDKPRDVEAGERAGVGLNLLYEGRWQDLSRRCFGSSTGKGSEQTNEGICHQPG